MKEEILKVLDNVHEAKEAIQINDMLGLKTTAEYQELVAALEELVAEYKVFYTKKNKYILLKNCPSLKIGKLAVNKKGFGFVILDREDDLYIDKDNFGDAIDGDIVLCEAFPGKVNREGKIIRVLKRDFSNVVGEVILKNDKFYLKLDDSKKEIDVLLRKETTHYCVEGHKVLAKIIKQVNKHCFIADVIKIIGHKDDPQVDILSIAYKYGIYENFGTEVEAELENIPTSVTEKECIGRRDLTNEMIFTIDGDDTKDIDDAISLEYVNGIYRLGVHIADVSNYVKENTALGDEAYKRGTSSYLADTVIPMLPHQLSNGICSLNPNEKRLTISCVMDINEKGNIVDYDIFLSVIKSKIKMTYKKVNDIIVRNKVAEEYKPYVETLRLMSHLADILRKEKVARGYIDFDLDEAKAIQDENGVCVDIVKRTREKGEMLIEDFMIAANETVAKHIYNMQLPFIYRVHENPKPEKVEEFMTLVKLLGYRLKSKVTDLTPKGMQRILDELRDKKEFKILSSLLLRSMRKAEYSSENLGHFGLASKAYTHFTSPIRRFPDLTVHRLLKTYLFNNDFSMTTIKMWENSLVEIASYSSSREVAAVNAERDVLDMKMAEYMESHIGEEYKGMITSVTNFGLFVELDNLVEGLVHVSTLKGDYFNYVEDLLAMVGKSTKKQYRIGDIVNIKVVNASKEAGFIDFEIVEDKEV